MNRTFDRFARTTPCAHQLLIAPALIAAFLNGCGGSGEGLDQNGRPLTEGGSGNETPLTADFQSIQDHVFTPICAQCHAGAAAPLGFRLDAGSAYAMLVNAPSVEVSSLKRVDPGHPDASYIVQKIQGTAAVGGQMPLGQTPLPQATIDVIRQWIANGAAPAAAQGAATASLASASPADATMLSKAALRDTALRVVSPIDGEVLTRSSGELLFTTDGELDASTLNAGSVTVTRGQTNIVQGIRIEIRTLTPTTLAVILPSAERVPGEYLATVHLTGGNAVLDRAGQRIGASDLVVPFTLEDLP